MDGASGEGTRILLERLREELRGVVDHSMPARFGVQLRTMLERVDGALALDERAIGNRELIEQVLEDVVIEAQHVLLELDRLLGEPPAADPRPGIERRQHPRLEAAASVNLLRHSMRSDGLGAVSLTSETTNWKALNVSIGGLFVAVPAYEVPQIQAGGVVHVSVRSVASVRPFQARAVVVRREADGLGLRWVNDSPEVRRAIEELVERLSRKR